MKITKNSNKISGWLWLPALALIIQPISFVNNSIIPLFKNLAPNIKIKINVPILIADLIILTMVAIVAWFYFTRKKIAPILFILQIVIMILLWEIMDGLINSQNDPPFLGMLFHSLIIIPFLLLSRRVKETFVEELNEKYRIDRIFLSIESSLMRVLTKLRNMKYLIFLAIFIFLVFCVLLNCALRSLRIDGDILHTFDYL